MPVLSIQMVTATVLVVSTTRLVMSLSHYSITATLMLQGEAVRLNKRNLEEATCKKYRIHKDGDTLRFHYYSSDGRLLGAKVKTKDKKFTYDWRIRWSLLWTTYLP